MRKLFAKAQDPISCETHALGAVAALGGGLLYLLRGVWTDAAIPAVAAALCFCLSMAALYAASAIYHYYPGTAASGGVKRVLRKMDHSMIYVLIAGSYTPFCVVLLPQPRGTQFCLILWGVTLAGVLLDEAALMPRSFVEQAVARCSVAGSRLWFNCNPENPQHWFYREWILRARERRALYLHFTMEDNPALSPRIRARYRSAYSGVFYRRFVLGEWTAAQGRVYDFFDRDRDSVPVPEGDFQEWRISVDYGTANPASFGLWGRQGEIWYRVGEFYYDSRREGRQKTDAEYVRDLRELAEGREITRVIVDPSAASFIEALRREGFRVVRADNDVADGIRVTADLLKRRRIVICGACADCLREMETYCWDDKGRRDAPKKEQDHAMDDLRYFAMDLAAEEQNGFAATWVERRA